MPCFCVFFFSRFRCAWLCSSSWYMYGQWSYYSCIYVQSLWFLYILCQLPQRFWESLGCTGPRLGSSLGIQFHGLDKHRSAVLCIDHTSLQSCTFLLGLACLFTFCVVVIVVLYVCSSSSDYKALPPNVVRLGKRFHYIQGCGVCIHLVSKTMPES